MFGNKEFPRNKGIPTPPTVPEDETPLIIRLPNSTEWWAVFIGLMESLTDETVWQQLEGGISREEAAEAAKNIYWQAIEEAQNPVTDCCLEGGKYLLPANATFRVEAGQPQFSYDGTTWSDITDNPPDRMPPLVATDGADDEARKCNAGERAVLVLDQMFKETFGAFGAGFLTAVTDVVKFLANLAPRIIADDIAPFGAVVRVDTHSDDWTSETLFGANDSLTTEEKDILRCLLLENATVGTGDIVTFDWEAVTDNLITELGANPGTAIFLLCSYIGPDGLNRAGNVGTATGDCSECGPTWCYEFDFTAADGGFSTGQQPAVGENWGSYSAGNGWISEYVAINQAILQFGLNVGEDFTITRIEALVNSGGGSDRFAVFYAYYAGAWHSISSGLTPATGDTLLERDYEGGQVTSRIGLYLYAGSTPSAVQTWKTLKLYGTGTNPFGEDNC